MTAERPLVSVIVCVFNAGEYLRASLLSVLSQTYREIEVIVVDDGSTDGCLQSIEDIKDSRLRVINQENRGKPAALNRGLDVARGEFYAVHDADDLSHPRRMEVQVTWLLANPEIAAVYCGTELILNNRHVAPLAVSMDRSQCRAEINALRMPAHDPTGMYRIAMVRDMRYDESLPIVEGFDYILRVGEKYPLHVLGECLYSYRIHRRSVTRRDPSRREQLVAELLRRACARRGIRSDSVVGRPTSRNGRDANKAEDNNLAAHFMDSVCSQRASGKTWAAVKTGIQCLMLHPLDPHYHKALVYAVAPGRVVAAIRNRRRQPVDTSSAPVPGSS